MRSLPTIAVALAVLAFVAWMASEGLRPTELYACAQGPAGRTVSAPGRPAGHCSAHATVRPGERR